VGDLANLLGRYAGADLAQPDHRARAISTVVWATTIGAVAGPNALGPAGHVAATLGLSRLAGPYVGIGCFAAAALITATLLRPDPLLVARGVAFGDRAEDLPRPSVARRLAAIWRDPLASVGLATMVVANVVMVSLMTMTPLHLRDHGDSLELVGVIISLHVAGMCWRR
jgi:MFS transporter